MPEEDVAMTDEDRLWEFWTKCENQKSQLKSIDRANLEDPHFVSEYIETIFDNMKKEEGKNLPWTGYMVD